MTLPQNFGIVEALAPAADAAGRTSDYICLKHAHRVTVICHVDQGNAAQVTFTLQQASAVAGTGKKDLTNAAKVWVNQDLAAADGLTQQTDAKLFQTSAAVKHKYVIFEVDPSCLDLANGFDCLAVDTSASNAANITAATFLIHTRYEGKTQPSYIVD